MRAEGVRRHLRPNPGSRAVAGFVHRTSRAGDPQVHTHCLIPNVVRREDGRCVAIAARPMFVWAGQRGRCIKPSCRVAEPSVGHGVAARSQQHPRDRRVRPRHVAHVLETDGRDRRRARSQRRHLRVPGPADASGRRSLPRHPPVQRPHRHPGDALRSVADRSHRNRACCRQQLEQSVCWRNPELRSLEFSEIARHLVDEDAGLCAHDARFAEHDVIEHVAGLAAGRLPRRYHRTRTPVPRVESCRSPRGRPRRQPGQRRCRGVGRYG